MVSRQNINESVSKSKLIGSGKALFYKYGYRKVTVEEICRDSKLSKMTFYRFFENKNHLVRHILAELSEEGMMVYREIMASDLTFEDKIRETIRMKRDVAKLYSEEFLKDIYLDQDGEMMPFLQKLSSEALAVVMDDYRRAQQQGQIRKDLNINFIPYFLNQMNVMVNDPALLAMYGDIHGIMTELTNLFFYGILQSREASVHEK